MTLPPLHMISDDVRRQKEVFKDIMNDIDQTFLDMAGM